jgi:predicted amidohydrolase
MLRRLGFFHFCGENRSDPVGSLRSSLIEAATEEDISGSLVVTPEAFNVRNGYWSPDRRLDPLIRTMLSELSTEFKIALVAGLIENGDAHGPGYSSAYLIDGIDCHVLTRKMADDGSRNYRLCTEDCDKPIKLGGASVAALICMDAADFSASNQRQAAVLERMASSNAAHKILCVPAHMMSYGSREVALDWPTDVAVVVANSSPQQPSVLRFGADASFVKANENAVRLSMLPWRF